MIGIDGYVRELGKQATALQVLVVSSCAVAAAVVALMSYIACTSTARGQPGSREGAGGRQRGAWTLTNPACCCCFKARRKGKERVKSSA